MPVQFNMVDFPMSGKLDMRTDDMDVQPPDLIRLENATVTAPGRFTKRPGIQAIGTNTYCDSGPAGYWSTDAAGGTGNLLTGKAPKVAPFKNQLVSIHNSRVMLHPTGRDTEAPLYVGRHFPFPIERGPANNGVNNTIGGSSTLPVPVTGVVQVGNYACYISTSAYLYLNVFDVRDGSQVVKDWQIGSTVPSSGGLIIPYRIAPSSTHLAVSCSSGGTTVVVIFLPISSFATGTPTISNTVTVTNVTNGSSGGYDLYGTGDGDSYPFHLAYHDSALGKFCFKQYSASGSAGATWTSASATSNMNSSPSIRTMRIVGTGYYLVSNTQGANTVRLWGANNTLTADLFSPAAILGTFTGANTLGDNRDLAIGPETFSDGTKGVRVWACGYSVSSLHSNVGSDVFSASTGTQINSRNFTVVYNKRIWSRAIVLDGISCLVLVDDPLIAGTVLTYPRTKCLVAFEACGASGAQVTPWTMARFGLCYESVTTLYGLYTYDVYVSGYKAHFADRQTKPVTATSSYTTYTHRFINADETNPQAYQMAEYGDYLYFGGGAPAYFDGSAVTELGTDFYPVMRFAAAVAGGSLPVATLNFTVTYEYTDVYGRLHRSPPAEPVSVAFSGGNLTAALYINPLTTSRRDLIKGDVRINIYRTTASDANTYYLCASYTNDPSAVSISPTITAADSTITANPTLYTTGGVLDNDVWPSVGAFCAYQNRLVVVDTEQNTLRYTKSSTNLEPPELSLFNEIPFIGTGMPLTDIKAADQLLVAFGKSSVYITTGQVSNDLGTSGQFQEWQPVSQTLGCTVPRATTQTSEGIWFVSNQGVQLFSQGQIQPIGLPITSFNSNTWYGAGVVEASGRKQVMFANYDSTNSISYVLVYDVLAQTWLVWKMGLSPNNTLVITSICQPTGATVPYYGMYRSGLAPRVATESTSDYRDYNGASYADITMAVRTGWINFGSNQSKIHVKRAVLALDSALVNASASCWITTKIYRNFDDTTYDTSSWALTSSIAQTPKTTQVRVRTATPRVETVSIEILVEPDTGYYSAGAALSGLSLQVGQHGGAARLPANKTQNV